MTGSDDGAHLRLVDLHKAFSGDAAVRGLSLDVQQGELLVLLGPSGCGKSTSLNMIAGFLQPDAGDVLLGGTSILSAPIHRRNMGVVFQHYSLFPHLTVLENTCFGLRRRKVSKADARMRAMEALALTNMVRFHDRYPDQLSGGQQQRVAIARALVIEPDLLLMDEPLSNLDAKLRVEMREQIRTLVTEQKVSTIFVTHDQEEALTIADRIGVMAEGLLLQVATPRDLYLQPENLEVASFVGRSNQIVGIVVDVGRECAGVRLSDGTTVRGRTRGEVSLGAEATVVVRPEVIAARTSDPASGLGTNQLAASLVFRSFLGHAEELHFQGCTRMVAVAERAGPLLDVGDACTLIWAVDDTVVFEAS